MNRHLVFAVLLLLGRTATFANEPAPVSHEHAAEPSAAPAHAESKPAAEEPPPVEAPAADAPQEHAATAEREPTTEAEHAAAAVHEAALAQEEAPAHGSDATAHEAPATREDATPHEDAAPVTEAQSAHGEAAPAGGHEAPATPHEAVASGHAGAPKEKTAAQAKAADPHGIPAAEGQAATPAGHDGKTEDHAAEARDSTESSIPELLNYASKAYEKGRYDMALVAYGKLLNMRMPGNQKKVVLIGYARTLRKKGELTKAVAVYERLVKDFQLDAEAPDIYLELGRAQRALGAYRTAITRFYNVLNSTIKLPEDGAARYRQLAKTAQFEIAETYFLEGNYTEASRFYARLRLLDLAPADRAKAHFKAAFSLQLAGDNKGAIALYRSYLEQNPDDDNVPEAHYQLATCLNALGRPQESLMETLDLLRTEKAKTAKDPKVWAYWQRRTGNQIANEFYERGNVRSALNIYDTLAGLSQDPAWSLPITYQMALCYERLGITDKAITSYKSIVSAAAAIKADDPRREDYTDLSRMSEWRLKQIDWMHNTERKLDTILPVEAEAPPPSAPRN
jgi:tetratricopeptide (TPR) repeat protein